MSIARSPITIPGKPTSAIGRRGRGAHLNEAVGHANHETHDERDEIADHESLLVLRPHHDAATRTICVLAISFLRLAEPEGLFYRRGAVISRDESRCERIQDLRRRRKVALERIHAEKPAFVVIEICEVETHLALSGRGDLDQPAAYGEALEGGAKL